MINVVLDTGNQYRIDWKEAEIVRKAMDEGKITVSIHPDGWRGAESVLVVARIVSLDQEIPVW